MNKYEHIIINITNPDFIVDRMKSLPQQILEHYEIYGWELCAVDDIYYFFKRLVTKK